VLVVWGILVKRVPEFSGMLVALEIGTALVAAREGLAIVSKVGAVKVVCGFVSVDCGEWTWNDCVVKT